MNRTALLSLASISILSLAACGKSKPVVQHLDPATWCDSVAGGPSGTHALSVDLSAAHAGVRFFAAELDGGTADVALADALDAPDALTDGGISTALAAYKAPLLQVCVVPADDRPVPAAQVAMQGAVAVVHPGTGDVVIPSDAAEVAIDLRDLPNREDLVPALEAAVESAIATPNSRGQWLVRSDFGLPPELTDPLFQGYFATSFEKLNPTPVPATGTRDLPIALITGPKMAQPAAELAADLRLSTKAFIVGADVRLAVAESCWQGVGSQGIAYRCRELSSGVQRWPDVIPADYPIGQLDSVLQKLPSLGLPDPIPNDLPSDRPMLAVLNPLSRPETTTTRLGDVRAALITAHGAARLFYPNFDTAGDTIDQALLDGLSGLPSAPDRATTLAALQRFTAALNDGQAFAQDEQDTATDKLPLILEQVNGQPVVRAAAQGTNVNPGDQILAIDGVSFSSWYQQVAPRISAANDADRLERAMAWLIRRSSATLTLDDVNGNTRDVAVTAIPDADWQTLRDSTQRPSGLISGTNDYYLNADGSQLDSLATLDTLLQAAQGRDGLVLDLRGTPKMDVYQLISGVLLHSFKTPLFQFGVWHGPEVFALSPSQTSVRPNDVVFDKKVVVLTGPSTQGFTAAAATALQDGSIGDSPIRLKFVGRTTAATAGSPSVLRLPGGFDLGFTGMDMLHADGTTIFEGKGIAPDVSAPPTQKDLAAGVDTELAAGVVTLANM